MPIIRVKTMNGEGDEGKEEKEKPTVRGKRLKLELRRGLGLVVGLDNSQARSAVCQLYVTDKESPFSFISGRLSQVLCSMATRNLGGRCCQLPQHLKAVRRPQVQSDSSAGLLSRGLCSSAATCQHSEDHQHPRVSPVPTFGLVAAVVMQTNCKRSG